jgi:hypothetical protein
MITRLLGENPACCAVFRIRIHFMLIQIPSLTDESNPDPSKTLTNFSNDKTNATGTFQGKLSHIKSFFY